MSVFYITGKDSVKGEIGADSGDLNEYFELGWEVMSTHCDVKELLYVGKINKEKDTVVTCEGREFLYQEDFLNVINWKQFKTLNVPPTEMIDLCRGAIDRIINSGISTKPAIKPNINKDIINSYFNFKRASNIIIPEENFICLVYRKRNHYSHRNIDDNYFRDVLTFLTEKLKLSVFIVGYGSEIFTNKNIFCVSLQEFTTLINHNNCKLCLSTLTGPPHLTYHFGNKNLKNIIIDIERARQRPEYGTNHCLAMGDSFNYKQIPTSFFYGVPELTTLFDKIQQNILDT
jgi:hypothetical protein